MKLSIVIVNYNVKHFLEQCLVSVQRAIQELEAEVLVVDNASVDDSVQMVREQFPWVTLIASEDNLGFSKGNNLAIKESIGEYVLLLNPDTVVQEDTFRKCVAFMDTHPDAGGLGVRMVDGKGNFLPESKRGLPKPWAAFYKMFGLSKLFPKSKKFSSYHLSYLSEFETNKVDVLSGAYMMVRKAVLDKIGLLDETFFMYGEDIDWSYRIQQSGYENYYFPETTIIHYKGESTKKGSVNYVFVFYRAMIIFAKKHFAGKQASFLSFLINLAIYFRASVSIAKRFFNRLKLPLIDTLVSGGVLLSILFLFDRTDFKDVPHTALFITTPILILLSLCINWISGLYERPNTLKINLRAIFLSLFGFFFIYSLLPSDLRYSRAFVLLAAILLPFISIMLRKIYRRLNLFGFNIDKQKRIAIVSSKEEEKRIQEILQTSISPDKDIVLHCKELELNKLTDFVRINRINEIVLSGLDLTASEIIKVMSTLKADFEYKIAQPDTDYLIGSNSIHTQGQLYLSQSSRYFSKDNQRFMKLSSHLVGILGILLFPLSMWFYKNKVSLLKNCTSLALGTKSLIDLPESFKSAQTQKGVLPINQELESTLATKKAQIFMQDFSMILWFEFLFKNLNNLDSLDK